MIAGSLLACRSTGGAGNVRRSRIAVAAAPTTIRAARPPPVTSPARFSFRASDPREATGAADDGSGEERGIEGPFGEGSQGSTHERPARIHPDAVIDCSGSAPLVRTCEAMRGLPSLAFYARPRRPASGTGPAWSQVR